MTRADACVSCGTELLPGARYCVKCGRTQPAPLMHLERVEVTHRADEGSAERAFAQQRGPRSPRRTLLALGAISAVIVATVLLMAGGGDTEDDTGARTTTTEPERTTRPRGPTTSRPPATSVVAQLTAGPVLGTPTGGRVLYVIGGEDVARVDLDTGERKLVPDILRGQATDIAKVHDGTLLVARNGQVFLLSGDLSGEPRRLDGFLVDPSFRFTDLISVDNFQDGRATVKEFDLQGNVIAVWQLPPMSWAAGKVGERLVVVTSGRIFLMTPDGDVAPFGVGDVIRASGSSLVWRSCDERMVCGVYVTDMDTGEARALRGLDDAQHFGPFGILIAPDARTAVVSDGAGRASLIDLSTGEPIAPVGDSQPAWSPDGAWLFAESESENDIVVAIPTRGGDPIEIPLDALGIRSVAIVLAVG